MNQEAAAGELDLTSPAYVEKKLSQWKYYPKSMVVVEYCDNWDVDSTADDLDRCLGVDGLLQHPGSKIEVARFATIQQAHAAALRIPNRRPDSILGVVCRWK